MPVAASNLLRPPDTADRAFKLNVISIESGLIAEITTSTPSCSPSSGWRRRWVAWVRRD
jgi:hypothetical protein